jgi:hypothetical protein
MKALVALSLRLLASMGVVMGVVNVLHDDLGTNATRSGVKVRTSPQARKFQQVRKFSP